MNDEKIAICGHCKSSNVYGVSRVVGYYSKINNWNKSKSAEFKARQNGNYKIVELQKSLDKFAQSISCPAKS